MAAPINAISTLWVLWALSWVPASRWSDATLWSSAVTLKADHTLVRCGPYRITRHPIYTGLLLAFVATALARDAVAAALGLGLVIVGLGLKVHQEERLLGEHFGAAYQQYRAQASAILPGIW